MANYKAMYELMAYQSSQALRLLREARIDQIYQAIDLLETAHRNAEELYLDSTNTKPFISIQSTENDKDSKDK